MVFFPSSKVVFFFFLIFWGGEICKCVIGGGGGVWKANVEIRMEILGDIQTHALYMQWLPDHGGGEKRSMRDELFCCFQMEGGMGL